MTLLTPSQPPHPAKSDKSARQSGEPTGRWYMQGDAEECHPTNEGS